MSTSHFVVIFHDTDEESLLGCRSRYAVVLTQPSSKWNWCRKSLFTEMSDVHRLISVVVTSLIVNRHGWNKRSEDYTDRPSNKLQGQTATKFTIRLFSHHDELRRSCNISWLGIHEAQYSCKLHLICHNPGKEHARSARHHSSRRTHTLLCLTDHLIVRLIIVPSLNVNEPQMRQTVGKQAKHALLLLLIWVVRTAT